MTNEFLLIDRLQKIKQIISKYGEENFYLSFSGGKDSTVLSALVDLAVPGNKIPRVYANTGIEYHLILDFVEREREKPHPWELVILKPSTPIKPTLEEVGYPFKSKEHAQRWREFEKYGADQKHVQRYLGLYRRPRDTDEILQWHSCPKILRFQFTEEYRENGLKISDLCCNKMKEEPLEKWQAENKKPYALVGIMRAERGRRTHAQCLTFQKDGNLKKFQPLVAISKEWEEWFIESHGIEISDIYKPPYNFDRTGCKGCPFALGLQHELDTLERFFPEERRQCETIWKPVYDEYRRLNYRLKANRQMEIKDFMKGEEDGI